tara:strand:+ start:77 stop:277 length:201 start_codon:yes stop_codon:yes gene_type:complete
MAIVKSLFSSKKFIAMITGVVATLTAKIGWDVSTETINQVIALVGTYILGQGVADHGKHRGEEAKK